VSLSENRRALIWNEFPNANCTEWRWLAEDGLERRGQLKCEAAFMGAKVLIISTSVEDGNQQYEHGTEADNL
jgi:hypothetical protein